MVGVLIKNRDQNNEQASRRIPSVSDGVSRCQRTGQQRWSSKYMNQRKALYSLSHRLRRD